ncbi:MAG TPA: serine/threonine-protein kinase, partial [Amaricoccus sp.]|nr:serine/threonine-protein kinase [Amaricoccus sp.]
EFSHNDAYLELMKREEEMRNIHHDAIVRYTDCSRTDEGHVYLVMDHVDGTPLADWMERTVQPRDLLVVGHRVAEGLVATHARSIVHRDLSPDNIILRGDDPAEAVIIDFGIAKDASAGARTIVGNDFAGKYEYAAPEQMHGRAEARSDLYALGASLLAVFRGRVPDMGGSPGEVLRKKEQPLDTAGVPEPLKGLIEALTQPDPARRPPSAAAAVAEIEGLLRPKAAEPPRRQRRRWWMVAVPALLVLALAGAWGAGLFDRFGAPPVASPFILLAERPAEGAPTLTGNAPDAEGRETIEAAFGRAAGAAPAPDALALASGAPVEDWAAAVAAMLGAAAPLETWRLELSDGAARLGGVAADAAARDAAVAAFEAAAAGAGLGAEASVAAGPLRLGVAEVEALAAPLADCGPLVPTDPGEGFYPLGATVTIRGSVAGGESEAAIRAAVAPALGDRSLRLDLTELNPALCTVLATVPDAPGGSIAVQLSTGGSSAPNLSGTYAPGDNPVIDLLAPATLTDGYLWVVIADLSDQVYHLLPNGSLPENALASLGTVEDGVRRIRVAYSTAEWEANRRLPHILVDANFGRSVVIVFHTDRPLFDELRGSAESAASFAKGLRETLATGRVQILSLTKQFIDSRG